MGVSEVRGSGDRIQRLRSVESTGPFASISVMRASSFTGLLRLQEDLPPESAIFGAYGVFRLRVEKCEDLCAIILFKGQKWEILCF